MNDSIFGGLIGSGWTVLGVLALAALWLGVWR